MAIVAEGEQGRLSTFSRQVLPIRWGLGGESDGKMTDNIELNP
jgi:hypothetical protein